MLRYCLIGHPLGHSISPQIHRRLFELSGREGRYELYGVAPDMFGAAFAAGAPLRAFDGFNVTIPYKQKIIAFLDKVSEPAQKYGAVNTVLNDGGSLRGFNTDVQGFLRALSGAGIALGGRVLLCGAGGVAHMMACEALDRGCALTVAARSPEKAADFAAQLRVKYPGAQIESAALSKAAGGFDLILNGTPAGMSPRTEDCPVTKGTAQHAAAVFDAVYNPGRTRLLRYAQAAGAKTQGGLPMLVWQAAAAQEIWGPARFDEKQLAPLCEEMTRLLERGNAG
ncbi:MAG: shikimate dehydrogenase [Clostridia bacterium]|nr:shikimate dehydrogenase [Clostridia bacterium]